MAYDIFMDRVLLPIPPQRIQTKINGQNRTITLINDGEINLLKKSGLTDITFSALLPNVRYPFANSGNARSFLNHLERLKTRVDTNGNKFPFQFIVSRVMPTGRVLFNTNIRVSLEDYRFIDDTRNGFDIMVDIVLKEYQPYGTKVITLTPPTPTQPAQAKVEPQRPAEKLPARSHTVVAGDSLWAIAQRHLGNGNRFPEIYELNRSTIDARNKGTGNTRFTIYPGQTFILPT